MMSGSIEFKTHSASLQHEFNLSSKSNKYSSLSFWSRVYSGMDVGQYRNNVSNVHHFEKPFTEEDMLTLLQMLVREACGGIGICSSVAFRVSLLSAVPRWVDVKSTT